MIYFDNSATTFFKPSCVKGAARTAIDSLNANPGRGSHSLSLKAAALVNQARKAIAGEVGGKSHRVIFTSNCSQALNLAVMGSVKKGHVVTTAYEHNSVLRPLYYASSQWGTDVTVIEPGGDMAKNIERALRRDTALVAVNHVSNVTGEIAPIEQIGAVCKKYGIPFLVDGAQSIGYQKIDMSKCNIDYLAIAPHKGLHALSGVGCLVLSETARLHPILYGGTGTASASAAQPTDVPDGFEVGTLPLVSIASLTPAVRWTERFRAQNDKTISTLSDFLMRELSSINGVKIYTPLTLRNGIISFNVGSLSSAETCDILSSQYDVCMRCGLHCAPLIHRHLGTLSKGTVRLSVGVDNTMDECETLLKAVFSLAKTV